MTIVPGTRFGPFEIIGPLGAGGMGEVYRARDTRLHREVALKLLPKDFAHDEERVARLTREARLLASLSHPNIAAIHGIEEQRGEIALVLELVEGPTLADRLASGALPVDSAVAIARQVAEAIEAAHARGVIHRDLKPSNLKITADGKVKVLDFGIAKALEEQVPSALGTVPSSGATTRSGVVIGTPGYMSPEQTTGGVVDRRADIWAFGCVVFETLAGRRAFEGATASETLVRVLQQEPNWKALPREVPLELENLLGRCLRKDPRQRLQDIGDARIEIEELQAGHRKTSAATSLPHRLVRRRMVLSSTLTAAFAVAVLLVFLWGQWRAPSASQKPAHLVVELPPEVVLPMDTEHPVLALSPDGTRLVFVGEERGTRRLYQRHIADPVARPMAGTDGAASPFYSPDGRWIGFFSGRSIKKVATAGGLPMTAHASTSITVNRGATWITTDSVVYAASPNSGLTQSSLAGEKLLENSAWAYVTPDHNAAYAWPHGLPNGRHVLFTDNGGDALDQSHVRVLSRRDRTIRTLVRGGTNPRYSPTGHLLFARGGALYAVPFNARRAQTRGSERRILDGVITEANGAAHFATSANGMLAYLAGATVSRRHELVWVDRKGVAQTLLGDREFSFPRLSPDGGRLAVTSPTGANYDVWILGLGRKTLERVTTDPGEDFEPVWSPDGTRLALASETQGDEGPGLAWTISADYRLEHLLHTPGIGNWEFPTSWSPDGQWLAFTRDQAGAASDVEVLPTSGPRTPRQVVATAASESAAMFSPNGRWVAYVSDGSGREEVYVQPFPGPGTREQVSVNGGTEPVWSRDGRELFYREGSRLMMVSVGGGVSFKPSAPATLFEGRYEAAPYGGRSANYDVSMDGRRFVMVRRKNLPAPRTIHLVFNWPDALLPRAESIKP